MICFPHVASKFWDLRAWHDKKTMYGSIDGSIPLPNLIAVSGDISRKMYTENRYHPEQLECVEALRYLHLNKSDMTTKVNGRSGAFEILVLGDYLSLNTQNQLKILQEAVRTSVKDIVVTFKPHPDCRLDLKQFPDLPIKVVQNSVGELIKDFKGVFESSRTSAGVEAYIAGCNVIVVKDSYRFNSSPLMGSHGVNLCSTGN